MYDRTERHDCRDLTHPLFSFISKEHFDSSQWVSSTKLKPTAVPSRFCLCRRTPGAADDHGYSRAPKRKILGDIGNHEDHTYLSSPKMIHHDSGCPMVKDRYLVL